MEEKIKYKPAIDQNGNFKLKTPKSKPKEKDTEIDVVTLDPLEIIKGSKDVFIDELLGEIADLKGMITRGYQEVDVSLELDGSEIKKIPFTVTELTKLHQALDNKRKDLYRLKDLFAPPAPPTEPKDNRIIDDVITREVLKGTK